MRRSSCSSALATRRANVYQYPKTIIETTAKLNIESIFIEELGTDPALIDPPPSLLAYQMVGQ